MIERALNNLEIVYAGALPANWTKLKEAELGQNLPDIPFQEDVSTQITSPKPGGVLHQDANGNKAWMYPDGTFDEVK